nr:uncharacterized protein LOC110354585 isoform X6 [Anas platyrhynchos]|eukprot:XP_027304693.1 uncharacterized protein LOC110354585 isoform X4 [Anas platyrhynchos]
MSGCGLLKTKQPGSAAEGGYHVERTESEQGLLSIVLLVLLQRNCNPKTSQNLKMAEQPQLTQSVFIGEVHRQGCSWPRCTSGSHQAFHPLELPSLSLQGCSQ